MNPTGEQRPGFLKEQRHALERVEISLAAEKVRGGQREVNNRQRQGNGARMNGDARSLPARGKNEQRPGGHHREVTNLEKQSRVHAFLPSPFGVLSQSHVTSGSEK